MDFGGFINAIIPWIIGIIALWLFIHALREPLGALWDGIKSIFGRFRGKDEDERPAAGQGYIQYE